MGTFLCPRGFSYQALRGQTMKLFTHPTKNVRFMGRVGVRGTGVASFIIRGDIAAMPVSSTVSQSDQGMQCKVNSGEKAEFTNSK